MIQPLAAEKHAEHQAALVEVYDLEDRDRMVGLIHTLKAPAIHIKIFTAGCDNPAESFSFARRHLRPQDAVCVGV